MLTGSGSSWLLGLTASAVRGKCSSVVDRSTPEARGARLTSRSPTARLFQCATTRERRFPGGRQRRTMPYDVSFSTAEPGSSARTLA
jgi:hypothetical protein